MSNTSISLKKSAVSGNVPASLKYGELAINYADGKLFYKDSSDVIKYIGQDAAQGTSQDGFATINANSTLILATTPTDTLTFAGSNGISISTNAVSKTITIGDGETYNLALSAQFHANAAFAAANNASGGSGGPAIDSYARATANAAFAAANNASGGGGSGGLTSASVDTFIGNNACTTFTLTTTPASKNLTSVIVGGVPQLKTAYDISSNLITFDEAPESNVEIEVVTYSAGGGGGSTLNLIIDTFIGNNACTTFTLTTTPASKNLTSVIVGGVPQLRSSYIISNDLLILDEAPSTNVNIEVTTYSGGGGGGGGDTVSYSQNASFRYSNTAGNIPTSGTLDLAQPEINLNDGRLYIQLGDGKIVDISSTPVGNTWYVSANGNDNFEGSTPGSAKATIAAAVAVCQPGDTVVVSSGIFTENNPIIVPQQVQLQGAGERNCIIKPLNPNKDVFWVNNNSYITGFKFINQLASAVAFPNLVDNNTSVARSANTLTLNSNASIYDNYYIGMQIKIESGAANNSIANVVSYNATTKVAVVDKNWDTLPDVASQYSIRIPYRYSPASSRERYTTYITGSPYIYNCSSIAPGGTGITIDGSLATGNKSIISAQFTQVNSGGTGIHVLNDGYSQLVSIYGIFCDTAFLAESGGTASMGNCNVNFGNKGLVAKGKGSLAMTANIANTSVISLFTIDLNNIVANSVFVSANVPYNGLVMNITGDDVANSWYEVESATPLANGNTTVTFLQPVTNNWSSGTEVKFYQQSQLRASGQTFEFVGAGTNINSIPRLGGIANTAAQTINIDEGRVFATSTDQQGNFTVADLTINQATSTISGRTFSKSLFAQMTPYILALES